MTKQRMTRVTSRRKPANFMLLSKSSDKNATRLKEQKFILFHPLSWNERLRVGLGAARV